MDDTTFEPDFREDTDSPRYPPPSQNPYTQPRTQLVQPLPPQNPYTQPRTQYVQPPPPQNLCTEPQIQYAPPPQYPHVEPQVQYVQPPLSQNPHAVPQVQYVQPQHLQRPPPQNPHPEPPAMYMQRPPQLDPHAEPHVPQNPLSEPHVEYVQPPQSSDAQVIYVQPPPQGGNNAPALWASGLYSCTEDPSNCWLTLWCPCVTFGRIAEIVDENSPSCIWSGGIHGLLCLVGIAAAVFIGWPWLTGFGWCYACSYRTKMRAKYNLAQTPCTDCMVHCCCEPCALCQEYRELESRGFDPALGWKRNAEKQKQGAMTPPAYQTMAK